MYSKLAFRNVRRSVRDYTIYFLTLTFGVCVFYVFNSIESQQAMMSISSSDEQALQSLTMIMGYVSVFISIILGFLILYANKFLIKRRKKELGIYMSLGMDKSKMSWILMLETLLIGIVSLTVGLILGFFLSEVLAVVTAKMFEAAFTEFKFVFSPAACGKTILYFSLIFIMVMLFNTLSISKYKLIDLLSADKKNETFKVKKLWHSVVIFTAAVIFISVAYYLIIDNGLMDIGPQFAAALACGSVGTLLFFMSLSGFLLRLVQSNKKLYLKGLNMFVLRQLNSKINTTFISMTVICIMLLFTIGTLSSGISLADVLTSSAEKTTPFDATITSGPENPYLDDQPIYADIAAELAAQGVDLNRFAGETSQITYHLSDVPNAVLFEYSTEGVKNMLTGEAFERFKTNPMQVVSLSDFNAQMRALGKNTITLSEGQFRIFYDMPQITPSVDTFLENNGKVTLNGAPLESAGPAIDCTIGTNFSFSNSGTLIVSDALAQNLPFDSAQLNINYKAPAEASSEILNQYAGLLTPQNGFLTITREEMYAQGTAMKITTSYVGIYVGIIFLIASAAILALQQLSEASDNTERYALLRKIGAEDKMIRHALFVQIAIYFLMPLALAVIHSIVGLKVANDFIAFFGHVNVAGNTGVTALILVLIYGGYFLATYFGSKNMIKA
ncbi:ABC transporter permease protein [Eubacterium limosum]|nr:ABC transporter permease protein [Eubacterium limosum]